MSENNRFSNFGLLALISMLLIGLKLTHIIHWSWWQVLSPLLVFSAIIVLVAIMIAGAAFFKMLMRVRK